MTRSIAVVTSLYPAPSRPREGVFAERRWLALAARGAKVTIVRPVPFAPWPLVGERGAYRAMPRSETRGGLQVLRPRYGHLPGCPMFSARRFARAAEVALERLTTRWGATPDAVVADYAWPAALLSDTARRMGAAFLISGRGNDILLAGRDRRIAPELKRALEAADGRLAVSAHLARAMDTLAGSEGTVLVPNGVDQQLFRPRPRAEARAELARQRGQEMADWIGTAPLVLVVGHLIERKDPLLALEAFARSGRKQARLVLVGEGPLERALAERARAPDLAGRVRLVGGQSPEALARWYGAADLLLLTSRSEGRPNVVLEALASGRPVLATDAGGTGEWLAALPECLLSSRDPADIAGRLAALMDRPPSPERCRAAACPFTWEAAACTLEALIEAALARRRA